MERNKLKRPPDSQILERAVGAARDEFESSVNAEWDTRADHSKLRNAIQPERPQCRKCGKPNAGPGDLCTCRGKVDLETYWSSPRSAFRGLLHQRLGALSSSPALKKFTETVAQLAVANDCDTKWVEAQIQGLSLLVKCSVRNWIITLCGGPCVLSWLKDERMRIPETELQQRLTIEKTDAVLKEFEAEIEPYFQKVSDRAVGEASIEMAKSSRLSSHLVPTEAEKPLSERQLRLLEVIRRGSKGLAYCREVDRAGVRIRPSWQDKGCSATYSAAYREKKWRHLISDEKTKINKKAAETSSVEIGRKRFKSPRHKPA